MLSLARFGLFFVISTLTRQCLATDHERGLGSGIHWMTLEGGLHMAKAEDKLLMLIVHKSWCGACKAFKPKFAASVEIMNLSKNFVMVNVQDDDEPSDAKYSPDGKYVPRILFLDPHTGSVRTDVYNIRGNPNYKYYYSDSESVVLAMQAALITGSEAQKREL